MENIFSRRYDVFRLRPRYGPAAMLESGFGRALPRMASLRSKLVNARSGPVSRYPIEWVYKQKNALPVEIGCRV